MDEILNLQSFQVFEENTEVELPSVDTWPRSVHLFDKEGKQLWALKAAVASQRPLLIRGEPGTGKSQLARVAAKILKRAFVSEVVNSRSECQDLQYSFDTIGRLGKAQTMSNISDDTVIEERLDVKNFITPSALWWAFDWHSAKTQFKIATGKDFEPALMEGCKVENGCVVLIDEIDKADSDVPNGLLETFGNGAFKIPELHKTIGMNNTVPPLVIITTNEERELPAAFIRRCLVLQLSLPKNEKELILWLIERGSVHPECQCDRTVMEEAAKQLWKDRKSAQEQNLQAPGLAEYLDILRAVKNISNDKDEQLEALNYIRDFAFVKNPQENM